LSKKILIVANYYPPNIIGGAEIVAHGQARRLRERGYSVSVFTRDRRIGEHSNNVDVVDGIKVTRFFPTESFPENNFIVPGGEHKFEALLELSQPDIVHFHNVVELGAGLIKLAKAKGFKTVITLHDPWGFCMRHTLIRDNHSICRYFDQCAACKWDMAASKGDRIPIRMRSDYIRWCLSNADLMISPSFWLKSAYEQAGYDRSNIVKLSNGINLNALQPVLRKLRGCVQFLYMGTLADHKGIDYLLDAAEKLLSSPELNGRWRLSIVGDGPKRNVITDRIRKLRTDAVVFMGYVEHVALLESLSDYDVIVLPSVWPENQSGVLLEAIASGAAQIASRLGGNTELVEHGQSGFLIMPRNATALADAMRCIIEDSDLLCAFSGRNIVRRSAYDENSTIDQLIRLYEQLESRDVKDGRLIICAGGEPPPEITWLVNSNCSSGRERSKAVLIWEEWATEYEWKNACAVWNWSKVIDAEIQRRASRYMLPLLVPDEPRSDSKCTEDTNLVTYRGANEAISYIDGLVTEKDPVRKSRHKATSEHSARAATCTINHTS
jgi:glycosyltransferase involved in cell wall biosynthesis